MKKFEEQLKEALIEHVYKDPDPPACTKDIPDEIIEIKCPRCDMPVKMSRRPLYRGLFKGFIYKARCLCNATIKLKIEYKE